MNVLRLCLCHTTVGDVFFLTNEIHDLILSRFNEWIINFAILRICKAFFRQLIFSLNCSILLTLSVTLTRALSHLVIMVPGLGWRLWVEVDDAGEVDGGAPVHVALRWPQDPGRGDWRRGQVKLV